MKQKQILVIAALVIVIMGLSACSVFDNDNGNDGGVVDGGSTDGGGTDGGGTDGGGTDGGTDTTTYETLSSTAEATSTLTGLTLRANGSDGTVEIVEVTGSLTHNTGAVTVSDDLVMDETISFASAADSGFSGDYDYVAPYELTYTSAGVTYDSAGFGGIVTRVDDVPTTGMATYTGEAEAAILTFNTDSSVDADFELTGGDSVVEADFGASTLAVTMDGFTATPGDDNSSSEAPIDAIEINDMVISENGFSGGALTTSLAGTNVDVTGSNATTSAAGHFFGYDSAESIPAEVAGLFNSRGDGGLVLGAFIAGGDTGDTRVPFVYENLDSMAGTPSALAGVALRANGDNDTVELVRQTGTLDHTSTEVTISDDIVTDETLGFVENADISFTGTYEYVQAYEFGYTSGGVTYESLGVGGIVTHADDVPTTGMATYTGEAEARLETFAGGDDLDINYLEGSSTVEADFGAGILDVTLGNFTTTDDDGGFGTASPFNTIEITGMAISGNAFSGGDLALSNAQLDGSSTPVDAAGITGTNTATTAAGHFFGWDSTDSIPDEVAGGLLSAGDDATISAGFIAD